MSRRFVRRRTRDGRVRIDVSALAIASPAGTGHAAGERIRPSLLRYDYLTLDALAADVARLLGEIPSSPLRRVALDLGSSSSPYRELLEEQGFSVATLDVAPGADYVGTAERTGLPDASFDLVLCTQVLEHCGDPWRAFDEMKRILKPGGQLLVSAPHVWFFHPHPQDHWRFGLVHLCESAGFSVRGLLAQGGSVLAAAQVANFLLYGVLGRLGAPIYAIVNLVGRLLDRVLRNDRFCVNFACLAQRR